MCKKLRAREMSNVFVTDAASWAEYLVRREYREWGDMDDSIDSAARKAGVDRGVIWKLRYRRPRDLMASAYFKLKAAYEAECERVERAADHERKITRITNEASARLVAAGDVLARQEGRPVPAEKAASKRGGE